MPINPKALFRYFCIFGTVYVLKRYKHFLFKRRHEKKKTWIVSWCRCPHHRFFSQNKFSQLLSEINDSVLYENAPRLKRLSFTFSPSLPPSPHHSRSLSWAGRAKDSWLYTGTLIICRKLLSTVLLQHKSSDAKPAGDANVNCSDNANMRGCLRIPWRATRRCFSSWCGVWRCFSHCACILALLILSGQGSGVRGQSWPWLVEVLVTFRTFCVPELQFPFWILAQISSLRGHKGISSSHTHTHSHSS